MMMRVDPFDQIDHLLRSTRNGVRSVVMPMDTYRHGDEFIAEFDLPGVDRDSIEVTVERNVLQITARREAHYDQADEIGARERPHGVMTRQLFLSKSLDRGDIKASYEDGVLRLVLPISEEAKPRTIQVTSGASQDRTAVGVGAAA